MRKNYLCCRISVNNPSLLFSERKGKWQSRDWQLFGVWLWTVLWSTARAEFINHIHTKKIRQGIKSPQDPIQQYVNRGDKHFIRHFIGLMHYTREHPRCWHISYATEAFNRIQLRCFIQAHLRCWYIQFATEGWRVRTSKRGTKYLVSDCYAMQVPKMHRQYVQPTEYLKLGGFLMVQQTFASGERASFWGHVPPQKILRSESLKTPFPALSGR